MTRILVVDDDPHIRDVLRFALVREGYLVTEAADGRAALAAVERDAPDLIVLDILMPEMDGLEVCRAIRKDAAIPIIFLSSKDDEVDRIVGLELGGDDYMKKPFSPRELVARIKAVLRRGAGNRLMPASRVIRRGDLAIDLDACAASWKGAGVTLSATEFAILRALAEVPGKVFSRDGLMAHAYPDRRFVSDRTIDSHIRNIRAKFAVLEAEPVETVHGFGYRLGATGT